jgi:RNA polymerase subunit RPABC4/transcription elongation factor Spt4
MDNSIQVQLYDQGTSMVVNIGAGKWIDKAGAAAVGAIVFAPLMLTAAIGAWANKKLPDEVFECIERFIVTGGKTASVNMRMSSGLKDAETFCPKCKSKNPIGTKFCNSCGEKLIIECPKCGAAVPPGTKFCQSCGANVMQASEQAKADAVVYCTKCNTVIPEGVKFCPECGTPAPVKLEEGTVMCPQCRKVLPEGTKFCPECGGAIPQKVVPTCPACGVTVAPGTKFCPECGATIGKTGN